MEVIPGVHAIEKLGFGRVYLYAEGDPSTSLRASRLTLIDTGLAGSTKRIIEAIEALGRKPSDLKQIVITHCHVDHAGSVAELVERTDAQVLMHALDARVVRGDYPPAGPNAQGPTRLLSPLLRLGARAPKSSRVDREVEDGDEIDLDGGATIVHVPGHTMGSIAVYVPSKKLLFTGDAAANAFGLKGQIGVYTEDYEAARASFRKLAELDFEVACFGHGKPLDRDASLAFRRAAQQL